MFGIVCAHEKGCAAAAGSRCSRSVALLLVMIGYTCAGLLLLFSP